MGSSKSQHLSVESGESLDREKNLAVPFIPGDPALHQEDAVCATQPNKSDMRIFIS